MNTVTQYGGLYYGKSGLYSVIPVSSLLLPVDRMEPVSEKLVSLGCESASDASPVVLGVRGSTEHAGSGDPVMNPTKVCLEPTCRGLEVSRGTSGSGPGSNQSVLLMKM